MYRLLSSIYPNIFVLDYFYILRFVSRYINKSLITNKSFITNDIDNVTRENT